MRSQTAILSGVAAGLVVCLIAAPVWAQLSSEDLAALRERGQAEGWTFTVGENGATARPLEELCGLVVPPDWWVGAPFDPCTPTRDLPHDFDWRDYGLPAVRNQGGCGSCWAFGTVGPIECNIMLASGVEVNLSEQWLVSCNTSGYSCAGGWWVHDYFLATGDECGDTGGVLEVHFPYVAWNAPCNCPYPHSYTVHSWAYVGDSGGVPQIDAMKQAILDYGPISVALHVGGAFQGYDGGVFNDCEEGDINHAVTVVGWDDRLPWEDGVWIMRNSWGPWWGENGYMRIVYACSSIGYGALYVDYRDCNHNAMSDAQDIDWGVSLDCNTNSVPDECDLAEGASLDCNQNNTPDECDIASGQSVDSNSNGVPDECEVSVLYVDADAPGPTRNGASWETAYVDLRSALATAAGGAAEEIWVAAGTYLPDGGTGNRSLSFNLADGVGVYGGFAGVEVVREQRDPVVNVTILSGDLDGDDGTAGNAENSYHVVWASGVGAGTVLDGFVIRGGNANAPSPHSVGGGIYVDGATLTLADCTVKENVAGVGGGGYVNLGDLSVVGCTFMDNAASAGGGGGAYILSGSQALTDCSFVGNITTGSGGGLYLIGGETNANLVNCLFSGNQAGDDGGGLCNFYTGPTSLANCTCSANTAVSDGGGVYTKGFSALALANCILWGNGDAGGSDESAQLHHGGGGVILNYSCLEGLTGGLGGTGNVGTDPLFVDADGDDDQYGTADDNLHLQGGSPAIDAANNGAVPEGVTMDLDGDPRFVEDPATDDTGSGDPPVVDMGAHEFQLPVPESIVSAASLIDHGGTELALDLTTNHLEPRQAGVSKIEFIVSGPVAAVSAGVDCLGTYGGLLTVTPAGTTVTVEFSEPLPNQDCCEITLTGDAVGSLSVRTLAGDIDRSGTVTPGDASIIKPHFTQTAAAAGPMFDFDCSGLVTPGDFSVVKPRFGHTAPACP